MSGTLPPEKGSGAQKGMAAQVVGFSRFLQEGGLATHPRGVVDACRAMAALDVGAPRQVYWALRANLVHDPERFAVFDHLYRLFWEEGVRLLQPPAPSESTRPSARKAPPSEGDEGVDVVRPSDDATGGASPTEVLVQKDLRSLVPGEEPHLRNLLQTIVTKLATRPSRRTRPAFRGRRIEFKRTFRQSSRYGGELVRLVRRAPKIKKSRVVFVGDVSGSMDVYSRFFLLLAHALARHHTGVEVYAFSTRLFRLTEFVGDRDASRAVERVMEQTSGWSGGTRIGECLAALRQDLESRPHTRDAAVVVFSDGWDRGDPDLLRLEIVALKRATSRIYWLNPLKGDPDYRPLCKGMSAALPYLDGFYPAHDIESLARFARLLTRTRRG